MRSRRGRRGSSSLALASPPFDASAAPPPRARPSRGSSRRIRGSRLEPALCAPSLQPQAERDGVASHGSRRGVVADRAPLALQFAHALRLPGARRCLRARSQSPERRASPLSEIGFVKTFATEKVPESFARKTVGLHEEPELLVGFPFRRTTRSSCGRFRFRHSLVSRIPKPPRQRGLADSRSNRERRRGRPPWHHQLLHHVGLEGRAVLGHDRASDAPLRSCPSPPHGKANGPDKSSDTGGPPRPLSRLHGRGRSFGLLLGGIERTDA
jgi:hypothetical protein